MRSRGLLVVLGTVPAFAAAGCGDDGQSAGDAATPAAVTLRAQTSLKGEAITLEAPKTVAAGAVTLALGNSAKAPIGVEIVRVDGNQTAAQVLKQINRPMGPIPAWIHGSGGAGVAAPGGTVSGTQVLQPGTHYLVAERDDDEGEPLAAKLEVTGAVPDGAALPASSGRIVADEYTFRTSGLKAGRNTIAFDNEGSELHHALAFPIAKGAKLSSVSAFFKSGGESKGPPPVEFEGGFGTPVLDGGGQQTVELELKSGRYALVCFLPNRAGSPPHVALGMLTEVTIP